MSEQSPVTATSLPPLALTNAARPGVTSGGIALLPAGVYSWTVQFSKNTAANVLVPAMCVARDSEHRSVHRTIPAVEHTTSLCRSLFLASSIVGPTASGSPASALAAAAAAAAASIDAGAAASSARELADAIAAGDASAGPFPTPRWGGVADSWRWPETLAPVRPPREGADVPVRPPSSAPPAPAPDDARARATRPTTTTTTRRARDDGELTRGGFARRARGEHGGSSARARHGRHDGSGGHQPADAARGARRALAQHQQARVDGPAEARGCRRAAAQAG
mmetsp:Transcript_9567/g.39156  ORF Transcript_9567/g.39156 Transcript_9567/m.39156 type:complete len:280 (+) Transcript_9567:687-1526(+)